MENIQQTPFHRSFTRQIVFTIEALNHTSGMPIATVEEPARIVELSDAGVWLDLPAKSCARGHLLSLFLGLKIPSDKIDDTFHFTGVVESLANEAGAGRELAYLDFRQHDPARWNALLAFFAGEQALLNQTLQRMRA
jgi:hypothetical protein